MLECKFVSCYNQRTSPPYTCIKCIYMCDTVKIYDAKLPDNIN